MKSPARVILIWAFAASVVLTAQSRPVPAPDASFGFKPGADYKLATYDQSIEYFRKLAAASKYVRLVEAGKTSQGRTMYFALISTPKNLEQIERYRQIAQRLAHPAGLTDAAARELAREGKPFVHIDGGLHSTEVAGAQHTPLLAYDLVSRAQAEDPTAKAILDNVILMLWPTINPDGQQMVSEWYMSNVGTPYELSGAAAALSGVRRPRQQPRRLHAEHDRVAGDRAGLARLGAEHRLRPPSVVAVSDAHLAAAVLRADRQRRAVPDVARSEHDRHGDRQGPRGDAARSAPRTWARRSTRGIPATSTTRRTSRTSRRSGPRRRSFSTRRRASTRSRTFPRAFATSVRRASIRARGGRDGGGSATPSRTCTRRRWRCSSTRRSTRSRCSSIATWPAAIRLRAAGAEPPFALLHSAGAARSGCGGRIAAPPRVWRRARLAADGAGDDRRRDVPRGHVGRADGSGVRRDGAAGAQRPEVSRHAAVSRRAAVAAVRRRRAGRCRCRWAFASCSHRRRSPTMCGRTSSCLDRRRIRSASRRPTTRPTSQDAAPFDSVPGIGFDSNPNAAAIVPPAGRIDWLRSGPRRSTRRRTTRFAPSTAPGRTGATVQLATGSWRQRYCHQRPLASRRRHELVQIAGARWRERPTVTASRRLRDGHVRPRIGLFRPWGSSMDEGWTRWVLEQYGFEIVTLRPADFRAPLREKVDVVILAEDARIPVEGGGGWRRRGRGAARAVVACGPSTPIS